MNKKKHTSVTRAITIIVMCFSLLLLTGSNFIIYPQTGLHIFLSEKNHLADKESPAPVEEKSSSKTVISIQEEYIHELHGSGLLSFNVISKHRIPSADKLQQIHFELEAPPPRI